MITADEALERLKAGNQRFAANVRDLTVMASQARREELVEEQTPYAIILGCSDSRVPAELIFDQGLGDLFVIRVAGNVIAPSLVGSVEFSAQRHGVRLVVVLGHTMCGAIAATVEQLEQPSEERSPNLQSIVNRIKPSVESLIEAGLGKDRNALIHHATRANIRASTAQLKHGSQILEHLIANDGLRVVGAEYSLETGVVEFFDNQEDNNDQSAIEH